MFSCAVPLENRLKFASKQIKFTFSVHLGFAQAYADT